MVDWPLIAKISIYTAAFAMIVIGFLGLFVRADSIIVSIVESLYFVYSLSLKIRIGHLGSSFCQRYAT